MSVSEKLDEMIDIETAILENCKLYHAYYAEICNAIDNGVSLGIILPPQTMTQISDQMMSVDEKCNAISSCIDTAMVTDEMCDTFQKRGMDAEYQNGLQSIMAVASEVNLLKNQIANILNDIEPHMQLAISRIRDI